MIIDNNPPGWKGEFMLPSVLEGIFKERFEVIHYLSIDLEKCVKSPRVKSVILSGSTYLLSAQGVRKLFDREISLIKIIGKPLLGICHGHQLLALSYGGEVIKMGSRVKGFKSVEVVKEDPIFEGLSKRFMVWENHREEVRETPKDFLLLAISKECKVEAMKHKDYPLYGLQFHPEKFTDANPAGLRILQNFMKIVFQNAKTSSS
ncbi:MAG: gamma-glutamyl-gamma-aminobutyrate hydrolase family protein [Candidatus Bathyarchaeia archaeon]